MKRAIAAALIASTLLAGLANAREQSHRGADAPASGHGQNTSGDVSRTMDAPYLAVPVVRDGQLVNYLFVSLRIQISPHVDLWRTREKAQFLRDALVRASHANSLADPNDNNALNQALAIQVYRTAAIQTLGAQAVVGVTIVSTYSSLGSGI
ncbi:MAG: hypothetical protein JSS00_08995 [Proteobacteria bacterium]|nr:hypothetical protein [Pseudomonadota bacterium]